MGTLRGLSKCHSDLTPFLLKQRQRRYREFVEASGIGSNNDKIRLALDRCQLTDSSCFVDEIEKRMGLRVESRGQGRPKKEVVYGK